MLDERAILNAYDIGCDPVPRQSEPRESPVHNDEIAVGNDCARLVLESRREALDQVHQTLAARLDVGTVLDVFRRPVALRGLVVALVEQRVERLKNERLVSNFL